MRASGQPATALAGVTLVLASLLLATPAAAEPVHDEPNPPSSVDLTPRGYKAKPMPVFNPRKSARASANKDVISDGEPTYIPGAAPTDSITPPLSDLKRARPSSFQEKYYPYSTTANPGRQVARFFLVDATGESNSCSATVVNAQNMSLAITAAHCVYDDGWNRSGYICPGYGEGTCKLGAWPVRYQATHTQWINGNTGFAYDTAIILLESFYDRFHQVERQVRKSRECGTRSTRRARRRCRRKERLNPLYVTVTKTVKERVAGTVQSVTGGQGMTWDQPVPSAVWAFGYPMNDSRWPDVTYDPRYLTWCPERQPQWVASHSSLLIACGMTGGSSGGPWLIQPDSNWVGYVNSVNSHKSFAQNGTLYGYGPYFAGDAEGSLYTKYRAQ